MIEISIINEQDFLELEQSLEKIIEDLVHLSLKAEGVDSDGEVSILFVDDAAIKVLNKTHRQKDAATDVLSFPQYESIKDDEYVDPYIILGDIVISTETAKRQALEYNHSLEREIGFLVVHSVFHLLGYDHDTEADTKEMRQMEEAVLSQYKLRR